jgi:hypothetical protein
VSRIRCARRRRELVAVDAGATVAWQLRRRCVSRSAMCGLGELAGDAADLDHRQRRPKGQHDRRLQEHAEEVANVVGAAFREALGAALEGGRSLRRNRLSVASPFGPSSNGYTSHRGNLCHAPCASGRDLPTFIGVAAHVQNEGLSATPTLLGGRKVQNVSSWRRMRPIEGQLDASGLVCAGKSGCTPAAPPMARRTIQRRAAELVLRAGSAAALGIEFAYIANHA